MNVEWSHRPHAFLMAQYQKWANIRIYERVVFTRTCLKGHSDHEAGCIWPGHFCSIVRMYLHDSDLEVCHKTIFDWISIISFDWLRWLPLANLETVGLVLHSRFWSFYARLTAVRTTSFTHKSLFIRSTLSSGSTRWEFCSQWSPSAEYIHHLTFSLNPTFPNGRRASYH